MFKAKNEQTDEEAIVYGVKREGAGMLFLDETADRGRLIIEERECVNHPAHYTAGGIECIDAIEAAVTGLGPVEAVLTGNVIKYMWRWKRKNGVVDLEKARWYLDRLIESAK